MARFMLMPSVPDTFRHPDTHVNRPGAGLPVIVCHTKHTAIKKSPLSGGFIRLGTLIAYRAC